MDQDTGSAVDEVAIDRIGEQDFLYGLVDNTSEGLVTIDADSRIVFANPAIEEIFGYRPEDLVGGSLTTLIPHRLRDQHLEAIEQYLESGERNVDWDGVELPGLHREGHEVPLEISFRETRLEGEQLFTGIIKDITERREYQRELERERDELRAELDEVLERISDAFFAVDDEWQFTYVNDRAIDLLDRSGADLIGERLWDAFPHALGTTFEDEYRRAMETQEPAAFEEYFEPLSTWFEVNAYPSETGLSIYFRDITERKEYEATLRALHEATRQLVAGTSADEIATVAIETATDVVGLSGVAIYRFDSTENALRPIACSNALEAAVGELPSIGPGEGITGRVFVEGVPASHGDVREAEHVYNPKTALRSEVVVPLGDHGVFIAASTDPGGFDDRTRELIRVLATTTETALDLFRRERDLRERDRQLEDQNRQLMELNRINRLIRQIDEVLVDASTREEIEAAVCEELVSDGAFELAWIGELDSEDRTVTPRTWAGDEEGYLDSLAAHSRDGSRTGEPTLRAAESEDPVSVSNVADGLREEPWRRDALTHGFQSVISVPLHYEDFSYGVLTVCSSDSGTFDERTTDVFGELGAAIANGINAVETKQGLLFDRVVELDIRITETADVLHGLAGDADCEVEFEGVIPRPDSALAFFTTADAKPDDIRALGDERVAIDHLRLVSEHDGSCLFEAGLSGDLLGSAIVEHGAVPRTITTDGTELQAIVDLPHTADVRDFIERLRTDYPDAELVARRERERSIETRLGFREELKDQLTDRQVEVLRTAYLSGYFDEPRQSSGRDLGAALDIAQPTFNSHLRAAQRGLLSMLFDPD